MRPEEREALRSRFDFRCGYCGVSETEVGAELTLDHYQPRSRGGDEEPANQVYCCFTCNSFKGDVWAPHSPGRILHPLHDPLSEHLAERPDGTLEGLTETGRFHITRLHLNRPALVAHRLARSRHVELDRAIGEALRTQEELRRRVEELEKAVAAAERRLTSL
jgi:hypothetical protein